MSTVKGIRSQRLAQRKNVDVLVKTAESVTGAVILKHAQSFQVDSTIQVAQVNVFCDTTNAMLLS